MTRYRTRRHARVASLIALALLTLAAVLLTAVWAIRRASAPPENGREIATAFLDDLRNNRVDAAWAGTTTEFKSFLGRERLHSFVRSQPLLRSPLEFSDCREVEANGLRLLEYAFRAPSQPASIRVLLAKEQGLWKVERLTVE